MNKTHWLQSPNKNYLGHWDLPEEKDLLLTIESAKWEEVINPIINTKESKRVVRFKEDFKPLICNQTNAQSILKATGIKFMEDVGGKKIVLFIDSIKDKKTKEDIDCIRIRRIDYNTILKDLKELYENKKNSLNEAEIKRADLIIGTNETESYSKLTTFLKSK